MYTIVSELTGHVGISRLEQRDAAVVTVKHDHHEEQWTLDSQSAGHHDTAATTGTPVDSPGPQYETRVYPAGRFMELAPLIMADIEGIQQPLDVLLNGTEAIVIRPIAYGDIHGYLKLNKKLTEAQACVFFRQMINVIDQAHRHGMVLRDLKLKKFVFTDPSKLTIALSDLEDAIFVGDSISSNDLLENRHGCPAYVAPEMLQPGCYSGRAADMWSAGVILFTLLVGHYPFFDTNPQLLFTKIRSGYYYIPHTVSPLARSLICSLLSYDPSSRPKASTIIHHPWFSHSSLMDDTALLLRREVDQTVPIHKLI